MLDGVATPEIPPVTLVPAPRRASRQGGEPFVVRGPVAAGPGTAPAATWAAQVLGAALGEPVAVRPASDEPADDRGLVVLALDDGVPGGDEAYRLDAGPGGARLAAPTPAGLFRAVATLRQLVTSAGGRVTVPALAVEDAPRYGWRGLSVDVARHFLPAADLQVVVDLLAAYKLNVLHLHLTDDQGWRLDLPSRPELVVRSSGSAVDGDPGGHYTAGDWAGLVAYAAARGVAVVPELDVPGHVNAALHAVPALVPSGKPPAPPYTGTEVGFSGLRAAVPETARFLTDVFGDLAAMTPGEYLHIGGDEALALGREEYVELVALAVRAVEAHGKRVVGWQEVAAAPLPPGTVVEYWDERADPRPILDAARAGARVLMAPGTRTYLDMKYTPDHPLGTDWAAHVELRDSYDWDPDGYLPGLDPSAVIGVEAAIWTETLRTLDEVCSMLLPRLAAVAEVAWSSSADWDGFRARVAPHAAAWDEAGWAWHPSPQVDWRR